MSLYLILKSFATSYRLFSRTALPLHPSLFLSDPTSFHVSNEDRHPFSMMLLHFIGRIVLFRLPCIIACLSHTWSLYWPKNSVLVSFDQNITFLLFALFSV
ncbi:hypothetical protein AMECASPLE_017383 [Ameca splendens]|uniref:Uncharacterized protein n=1 Tax=Ameca splendens TaxID=208324 RepID=A0ABV0ZMY6_9TELE